MLIFPRAHLMDIGEPALHKLLALTSYAYYPALPVPGAGNFFMLGDIHSYSSQPTSNGTRIENDCWFTLGVLIPCEAAPVRGLSHFLTWQDVKSASQASKVCMDI